MRKSFGIIILALTLLVSINAFAQETKLIHPADYYSVSLDGEGDAVVKAKLNIENIGKIPVSILKFEFPEQTTIFRVLQANSIEPLDFQAEHGSEETTVTIELAQALQPNQQTQLSLLYKSSGLATKDFLGNLNFDFKTIVDRQAVLTEKARVAINLEPGFFLKGAVPEIDYKPDFFSEGMVSKAMSMEPTQFRRYYESIENARGLAVHEAFNLDALESLHVKGTYNWNFFALFANEILALCVLGLAIGIALISFHKKKAGSVQKQRR